MTAQIIIIIALLLVASYAIWAFHFDNTLTQTQTNAAALINGVALVLATGLSLGLLFTYHADTTSAQATAEQPAPTATEPKNIMPDTLYVAYVESEEDTTDNE